jgi:hypothetical protein
MRTLSFNVAVGKKSAACDAVILPDGLLAYESFFIQAQENILRNFVMQRQRRSGIIIEVYVQTREGFFHAGVIAVNDGLRRYILLVRADGDRNAVFIRAADEKYVRPLEPLIADVNVRGNVCAGQMPQMQWAVGVRQRRRYKNFFAVHFMKNPFLSY